jgi:SAM-dependent methyltransferase
LNINVPSVLRPHESTLREFFEGMVFKLTVNAHKDDAEAKDIPILIDRLMDELRELRDEINRDGSINPNALTETFDMANFCYLLYQFMRRTGVMDDREQFIRQFFRVDKNAGKIYASCNRSGSRYREGEEILGTYRKGRCYIRTQHAVSGASVSLPRDHIVFWSETGRWPIGELAHANGDPGDDRFINLDESQNSCTKDYPFVSQWKPKGKENHSHYGRWCYQRRHNMILVKVGYYDSAEEAARQGLKDWKRKTAKGTENV